MNPEQKYSRKKKVFIRLALALVVMAAIGFGVWRQVQAGGISLQSATPTASSAYKTTSVRLSDLSNTISGSGTVITAQSVDLGFSVAGTVSELYVQSGDQVTQGQELASLGDTATLKQTILDQKLAVQVAQKTLDDLLSGASGALAQAQADQASAEQTYAEAQANAHSKGDPRCMKSKTEEYYYQYLDAQKSVNVWEGYLADGNTGYGHDYLLQRLQGMRKLRDQAYGNYVYCQGFTDKEIQTSQANLQLAKAKLDKANSVYETLKASNGLDTTAVSVAEADLKNAQLQLSKAQTQLAGTVITAPMSGTVTLVNGAAGDDVDTGVFITISDMTQPEVQVNIDETDLENFATGCAVVVTFDSLTNETFSGVVTQVSPALVTVNSSSMVQGLVDLQKKQMASGKTLSVGMTAAVEISCKQVKAALVVPAHALYQSAGQSVYVYVLNQQGQPEKREVVVGLETVATAQITSGLSEGEKVITSSIESK